MFRQTSYRSRIANYSYNFVLRVELTCPDLDNALRSRQRLGRVLKVNRCHLHPKDVTLQRANTDLRMRLQYLDSVFKRRGAVTFNLKLLAVGFAENTANAHVDNSREQLSLFAVYDWEGVDWH
jgi:hypothetical protein